MNNPLLAVVVNHLWQSTLVLLVIGCTAMVLRRSDARVRYWLWLAASMKFLVPFALLGALGTQIPWPWSAGEPGVLAARALELAGGIGAPMTGDVPFPQVAAERSAAAAASRTLDEQLTMLALILWAAGTIFMAGRWVARWLGIQLVLWKSTTTLAFDFPARVRVTTQQVEPGIVGIIRPALLLPAGIESRLTREQLSAVLAHERCHLRSHDNLTASLHMLVEAIFWFFPPVRWVGARLIEERERACDEQVVREGHAPEHYAEGILAVCEHYIASRLPCVSGVSGADLKQRIESIVENAITVKVDRPRRLMITAIACVCVAAPVTAGMVSGSTIQMLFSLNLPATAVMEYTRYQIAALELKNSGFAGTDFTAYTCPTRSPVVTRRRDALAVTSARLSPDDGDKVLLFAVAANSPADVQRLLDGGANRGGDGFLMENSLMHIAARFADPAMLRVLADAGFSLDDWHGPFGREGNGQAANTPLMVAVSFGRRDNVEWLIERGADVDATNEAGTSALTLAMISCGQDQALVSRLIRAGARPNDKAQRIAASLGLDLQ